MVAVLIVVLRLRSLQLSAGLGEPEERVEYCMYLVFLGLLGRLLCSTVSAAGARREDSSAFEEQSRPQQPEDEPMPEMKDDSVDDTIVPDRESCGSSSGCCGRDCSSKALESSGLAP